MKQDSNTSCMYKSLPLNPNNSPGRHMLISKPIDYIEARKNFPSFSIDLWLSMSTILNG